MPAIRRSRHARKNPTLARVPLPRITDPYSPHHSPNFLAREEAARVKANKKIRRLIKKHEKSVKQNVAIHCVLRRAEANAETGDALHRELSDYENRYGKFVPDTENQAWFEVKQPRIEAMTRLRNEAVAANNFNRCTEYFEADAVFKKDFGHNFSPEDGFDRFFSRMKSYARTKENLEILFDDQEIIEAMSKPLTFEVSNPYDKGTYDQTKFDILMHKWANKHGDAWPAKHGLIMFSFPNPHADAPDLRLRGFCECVFVMETIKDMAYYHREDERDEVGNERDDHNSPWIQHPYLWDVIE
ncbi:hypothetical protein C8R43DRAFT_940436 [Mycena crocata]|nr:hypothetical protein C8R43DRAFT_940436 [Mycena crocata]